MEEREKGRGERGREDREKKGEGNEEKGEGSKGVGKKCEREKISPSSVRSPARNLIG